MYSLGVVITMCPSRGAKVKRFQSAGKVDEPRQAHVLAASANICNRPRSSVNDAEGICRTRVGEQKLNGLHHGWPFVSKYRKFSLTGLHELNPEPPTVTIFR